MNSLTSLLLRQDAQTGVYEKDDSHLKKIRSPGGQEFYVHSSVSDFIATADKTQTEPITLGTNSNYPFMHFYTLKSVKRDSYFQAVPVPKEREKKVKV